MSELFEVAANVLIARSNVIAWSSAGLLKPSANDDAASSTERRYSGAYGAVVGLNRTATRVTFGAISLIVCSHLPNRELKKGKAGYVAAWPCQAGHKTSAHGIGNLRKHNWDCACFTHDC